MLIEYQFNMSNGYAPYMLNAYMRQTTPGDNNEMPEEKLA